MGSPLTRLAAVLGAADPATGDPREA